jgi:uncharacterized protein (TIGR02466 family)
MQAEITPLFSVPVYQALVEQDFSKELDFITNIELMKAKNNHVSTDYYVLEHSELERCKKICQEHLDTYIKNTLDCKQEFYITNSWVACSRPGESHHVHAHPNSIVSGVLYLKASNNCGNIIFHHKSSLRNHFDFSYDLNSFNMMNSPTWRYNVQAGHILLFPSWVNHSVEENRSGQDRIVLGFNTFVRGTFGEAEYSANLKI